MLCCAVLVPTLSPQPSKFDGKHIHISIPIFMKLSHRHVYELCCLELILCSPNKLLFHFFILFSFFCLHNFIIFTFFIFRIIFERTSYGTTVCPKISPITASYLDESLSLSRLAMHALVGRCTLGTGSHSLRRMNE